jgi:hypothetical protein
MEAIGKWLLKATQMTSFISSSLYRTGKPVMIYEDGNGIEHAYRDIPYTNFPMTSITLDASWNGDHSVLKLPSEY